jgi:hypothetical protein
METNLIIELPLAGARGLSYAIDYLNNEAEVYPRGITALHFVPLPHGVQTVFRLQLDETQAKALAAFVNRDIEQLEQDFNGHWERA